MPADPTSADRSRSASRDSALSAASSASDLSAALTRIVELETQLAAERAKNSGRAREVEAAMRVLRASMSDMQAEAKRHTAERRRLEAELERTRIELDAVGSIADGGPDQSAALDRELTSAQSALSAALGRNADLESQFEALQGEVTAARDDASLMSQRLAESERALQASMRLASAAAASAPARRPAPALDPVRDETAAPEQADSRTAGTDDPDSSHSISIEDFAPRAESAPVPVAASSARNEGSMTVEPPVTSEPAPPPSGPCEPRADSQSNFEDLLIDDSATGAVPEGTSESPAPIAARAAVSPLAPPPSFSAQLAAAAVADAARAGDAQASDPSMPEIPGLRIERILSNTPQAQIYEARETNTRRPVLVRVLPGVMKLLDGKRLDSLLLAKHPNLVSVLQFAVARAGPYIVQERPEGESADAWIRRVGPLSEKIALAVVLAAARGLRQAAFHGALHGDLSPATILVDATGNVRVVGTGLRAVVAPSDPTVRSPSFASPERLRGSPPPDARSDIYSLGVCLWFLLTGKLPYEGEADAIRRLQALGAPGIREVKPEISDGTSKLLQRLMATDPDQRHMTWDQVLVDLERRVPGRASADLQGNLRTRVKRFVVANPWSIPAAVAGILVLALVLRSALSSDVSATERFRVAKDRAEALVGRGERQAALEIYRAYVSGQGDATVEREAARRFDELSRSAK